MLTLNTTDINFYILLFKYYLNTISIKKRPIKGTCCIYEVYVWHRWIMTGTNVNIGEHRSLFVKKFMSGTSANLIKHGNPCAKKFMSGTSVNTDLRRKFIRNKTNVWHHYQPLQFMSGTSANLIQTRKYIRKEIHDWHQYKYNSSTEVYS